MPNLRSMWLKFLMPLPIRKVFGRNVRKRTRMMRELESLNEDNAGKRERDQMAIWRKMQKFISRNDDIANEYVMIQLFTFH